MLSGQLNRSDALRDYARTSFWLETAGDDLTPRPRLVGDGDADVAILGAGFTGLWTAYYLLDRDPSLRVILLEAEIAGFGASGRNGGWCTSGFSVSPFLLEERHGREAARALMVAMIETVDEVGRVCGTENIDAQFRKGGELHLARGAHQLPGNQHTLESYRRLGLDDRVRLLSKEETLARVRVSGVEGGLWLKDCAAIHPGRLVRGLARAVERRGATIYEQTPVVRYVEGPSPRLDTAAGRVSVRTIVLAGEAYLSRFKALHRRITPIYSLITLTEPLPEAVWAQLGWERYECVSSGRYTVDYLQRTCDNRILFGSRGEPYHWGSRIEDAYDRHAPTHEMIKGLARAWFPVLRDFQFTHAWGGPVGMPRDWMPTVHFNPRTRIAGARGYTGQGVSTTNLAGRLLADLITETPSHMTGLPLVNHHSPRWEPEPFRWLGIRAMQRAYAAIDARAERTGRAPTGRSLPERLGRH